MQIRLYCPRDKKDWDEFVARSKNGTFLFQRDYMDYHVDRFTDCSLIIRNDEDEIISLLPAHSIGNSLISHDGLTYGGFITNETMTIPMMLNILDHVMQYLWDKGFVKFIYKTIPHIYHSVPAEEDLYCLFRKDALLYRRDVLTVIDYRQRPKFQERRIRGIKKAYKNQIKTAESNDYEQCWDILTKNLHARYGRAPVHSLQEITLLASRFPEEIKLFVAYREDIMHAGILVYLTRNVCHTQYVAISEEGKKSGALDLLTDNLIKIYAESKRFFDFGISTEDHGRYLNVGLVDHKEGFGARAVAHDFYELDLTRISESVRQRRQQNG